MRCEIWEERERERRDVGGDEERKDKRDRTEQERERGEPFAGTCCAYTRTTSRIRRVASRRRPTLHAEWTVWVTVSVIFHPICIFRRERGERDALRVK